MTTALTAISDRIIACAHIVANTLGSGLPEIIYENALAHELRKEGLAVSQQEAVAVYYNGTIVGDYTADLLVEKLIMVELKPITGSQSSRITKCRNYLQATGHPLCVLFSFGNATLGIDCVGKSN